ncbi:uncharacterized protein [Triticum aestivum]|uniref:uncharacterized protein n=1 Tax=Triticum aestivum TaxID=4565 RepID=UPI001D022E20|nr:uncharacterized protein LOC123128990 [Triticum aestivum]
MQPGREDADPRRRRFRCPAPVAPSRFAGVRHFGLPFSSSSKSARDWYLLQREHYDSVTRELKNYSREVVWTERLAKLLNVVYVLGTPFIVGPLVLKGIAIRRM